nr:serine hydrolase domain-containing protein [uncultured Lacibacter sp.]
MKQIFSFLVLAALFLQSCRKDIYSTPVSVTDESLPVNNDHPMKDSLIYLVNKYATKGIPGVQVMVKNADGLFVVNSGYAKLENKTPVTDGMTAWIYSISKTYLAVVALRLKEKGLLDLDAKISTYLSASVLSPIPNANKITVRQLMNHSAGLRNHTSEPTFQIYQINNPFTQLSLERKLEFIHHKPAMFEPGTDFLYSNTGYTLLQWVVEKAAAKPYAQLLKEEILDPLHLTHTYYSVTDEQILSLGFPNYYFERYNNGQLENVTKWHNTIAKGLQGYGGIAANGHDVIRFMEALVNGYILSPESLTEMRTWIQGKESTEPDYGLGLEYFGSYNKTVPTVTYGHEGDGLGATTQVLYVPANNTYLFITMNAGRQLFGEYLFKTSDMKIDLSRYVATWR